MPSNLDDLIVSWGYSLQGCMGMKRSLAIGVPDRYGWDARSNWDGSETGRDEHHLVGDLSSWPLSAAFQLSSLTLLPRRRTPSALIVMAGWERLLAAA